MSDGSDIEWTDATWNTVRGCNHVSPGCKHCYAEQLAHRFNRPGLWGDGLTVLRSSGPGWSGRVDEVRGKLDEPLRWRLPRLVFPCSTSDIAQPKVSVEHLEAIFGVMCAAERHTFQVLTKWPGRLADVLADIEHRALALPRAGLDDGEACVVRHLLGRAQTELGAHTRWRHPLRPDSWRWPRDNVQVGATIEDQPRADERVEQLRRIRAAKRWLSIEPLIGPVDLSRWLSRSWGCTHCSARSSTAPTDDRCASCERRGTLVELWGDAQRDAFPDVPELGPPFHWGVVGLESGLRARAGHVSWVRDVVDQFRAAGLPIFVKQLGDHPVEDRARISEWPAGTRFEGTGAVVRVRLSKAKGGDMAEWPASLRVRLHACESWDTLIAA